MDRAERLEAVRERLGSLKTEKLKAARAGPSCEYCIHGPQDGSAKGICGHIAHVDPKHDAVTGDWNGRSHVSTITARSDAGLCGPEALLFERITMWAWIRRLAGRHL